MACVTCSVVSGWLGGGQCIARTGVLLAGLPLSFDFSCFDDTRFASASEQ